MGTPTANKNWLAKNPGYMAAWLERHPGYLSWKAMIQRCTNPNAPNYYLYGGRGVTVCDRWIHSYDAFFADMGERPSDDHSIDRIDNEGDYEPSNCRWATRSEQQRNKRSGIPLEIRTRIVRERAAGKNWQTIADGLNVDGVSTPRETLWSRVTTRVAGMRATKDAAVRAVLVEK